jgi:hypothetical protein
MFFYVRCILPTITSSNVTISHINNQVFYRSHVYTICSVMFVVLYTQSLVLMLQYHLSTTKHSTVPVFIRYVLVCVLCILPTSLVLMVQCHISTNKHSTVPVFIWYVLLYVRCILHTITSTNVTISHINHQTFYRSLVYTVCYFICLLYFTHNYLY